MKGRSNTKTERAHKKRQRLFSALKILPESRTESHKTEILYSAVEHEPTVKSYIKQKETMLNFLNVQK